MCCLVRDIATVEQLAKLRRRAPSPTCRREIIELAKRRERMVELQSDTGRHEAKITELEGQIGALREQNNELRAQERGAEHARSASCRRGPPHDLITVKAAVDQASREIGIAQFPIGQAIGSQRPGHLADDGAAHAVADEVLLDQPYETTLGDGYWLLDAATGVRKKAPTADTDIILFDGRLAINGLKFGF